MAMAKRPLSPHLQVYRWQWTMAFSILHRATGCALVAGTLLLVYWLAAAASGPEAFDLAQTIIGSILGQLCLLGWTFSLYYHLSNGIRHLVWDAGYGFELENAYRSGLVMVASACVLTFLTWVLGYYVRYF